MGLRFLISAGRTDEHELASASAEQLEIAFDVGRGERDPIDDGIKGLVLQFVEQVGIVDVGNQSLDAGGKVRLMLAAA